MIEAYLLPVAQNVGGTILHILPFAIALAIVFTGLHWLAEPCNK
jgi:hypothetical protein